MDSTVLNDKASAAQPQGEPNVILAQGVGTSALKMDGTPYLDLIQQMKLPGIVIFVHGVNSDGEWYQAAEKGLCDGLNTRMARNEGQIAYASVEGGKMTPVSYLPDLTPDGYLNPNKSPKAFIKDDAHFSPVIQFRWGYKGSAKDLQTYGDGLYLNERSYWGGGPFANGCTSIPDLWEGGLNDQLFLWLHAQHLNPTYDRMVYACPHRAYYVLAALRLARLVGEIRKKQADVPVTIVCHSQGNMVSIAAAFLGDRLGKVTDEEGKSGNCVANTYVLCNPPYSLLKGNAVEGWTQLDTGSGEHGYGRQTYEARIGTLKNFFDIMREQAKAQPASEIDMYNANEAHDFTCAKDGGKYGHGPGRTNHGRVTLYFNPHDQVISSTTIQGIGWRGMSQKEIREANGTGVFCQRVFAEGFQVGGTECTYHFWNNHHVKGPDKQPLKPKSQQFWYPESPRVQYSVKKGLDANEHMLPKILTAVSALFLYPIMKVVDVRINALPDPDWETPLSAPPLGNNAFLPRSVRFEGDANRFDEGLDAPGFSRNRKLQRSADDPYGGERALEKDPRDPANAPHTDAALGDENTEASMMYEHHALLRMRAKRDALHKQSDSSQGVYGKDDKVTEEDDLATASDGYKTWRAKIIKQTLVENVGTRATDHSSILTNPEHSKKALAYDIPVGACHITNKDFGRLRKMADWRFLEGLDETNPIEAFASYFNLGKMGSKDVASWATTDSNARLPPKVLNKRSVF
jgi:pimeloyl-ACP methyl ester carboxylesterase